MFIELTDQLRCPAEHPEAYLVLIPQRMEGRLVQQGLLGCPLCRAEYRIAGGVAQFGEMVAPAVASGASPPDSAALLALLGLEGPGGYLALLGGIGGQAEALAPLLPGVHLALVNPPPGIGPSLAASVLRSARLPLKSRSMRGVVLSAPWAAEAGWAAAAVGAVLPGLRAVGEGEPPAVPGLELLGSAGGWWVGRNSPTTRGR
jgi:uncharacterized protein YbaR (Trm112 family)